MYNVIKKLGDCMNIEHMINNFEKSKELVFDKLSNKPENDTDILFQWILKTETNPYQTFEKNVAPSCESIESLANLYHEIHHALEDDGDLTLVDVTRGKNRHLMIIFDSPGNYEDPKIFNDKVKANFPEHRSVNFKITTDVNVFKGSVTDFVEQAETEHVKHIKNCFLMDASRIGAEHATNNYKKYECFDEKWGAEVVPIEERLKRQRRQKP